MSTKGFDDKDVVVEEAKVVSSDTIEKITFIRNRELSGVQLEVHVEKRVIKDGRLRIIHGRVPEDLVNAGWDSASKKLKDHMLSIIDDTQF